MIINNNHVYNSERDCGDLTTDNGCGDPQNY